MTRSLRRRPGRSGSLPWTRCLRVARFRSTVQVAAQTDSYRPQELKWSAAQVATPVLLDFPCER
jgi:hypothetical protein